MKIKIVLLLAGILLLISCQKQLTTPGPYRTIEEWRQLGYAHSTLEIQLLTADSKPMPDVLVTVGCDGMIGGVGGITNDDGHLTLSELPALRCKAHTRILGGPQAERTFQLISERTTRVVLVWPLDHSEFIKRPSHI